ncbi:MAG: FAD-dependent oxidoreductase [Elusimicrobia bacterium]|nr:FAD-dependent oxidoreductase [Elusimicrobiota bacterium]
MPVHPEYRPKLLSSREVVPGVRLFRFEAWPGFTFLPGQFLMFHFADDPKTWRAYSVCSDTADSSSFEVAIGMVGAFSDRLGALKPGEEKELIVRGPFGKWTWSGEGHAVLIAGGTGVTPFRAMALLGKGKKTIFYSSKNKADRLFGDEHAAWAMRGATVHARATREGESRWTAAEIVSATDDSSAVFFICGPKALVEDMKSGLAAAGVDAEKIRTEKWGDYTDLF